MIKIVWSINDINKYQTGNLLDGAVKIETPQSVGELMKKAVPIAVILCVILFIAMLCKTIICKTVVISPIFILVGFAFGFLLLIIHEWLHGIVYPKEADVTIGRIKGKATFVAALPSIPTLRPMKNWSTILYKALTTIAIILGIAKRRSKFDIFSVPSGFVFCSFIINKTSSFYNIYNIKDCRNDRKWSKRTLSSIV